MSRPVKSIGASGLAIMLAVSGQSARPLDERRANERGKFIHGWHTRVVKVP